MTADAWWWSDRRDGVVLGFTQRGRGASTGPYRGLNLGLHVEDDPTLVRLNRATVLQEVAALAGLDQAQISPVFMQQVHGAEVVVVPPRTDGEPPAGPCDAVVVTRPGVALFTLVADCTPVLLVDAEAQVAAAVHAGRPGMLAGVVPAAVAEMRRRGARRITAVVGPSVCGRCYEVPERMRAEAASVEPVSAAVSWVGTAALDVASAVVEQLRRAEVEVTWVPGCSREEEELFSYRRDGSTGRFAGIVMLTGRSEAAA